jgi:hypothetical protein
MDLWSKGLGRRVLSLSLDERDALETRGSDFVISGVMHAPTFWDYEVTLDRQDVVDFLDLLQRPDVVRFVAVDEQRTPILRTAISSAAVFAVRTLGLLVRRPRPATDAIPTDNERASHGRT